MIRAAAVMVCLGTSAMAQSLPGVFDVIDVARDDVLNIRRDPFASADIIGTLAPQDTRIEVIATTPDAKWGKIGTPEGNGWVAMRYMSAQPQTSTFPTPMTCYGTEPFWSLRITDTVTTFDFLGGTPVTMTMGATTSVPNEYFAEFSEGVTLDRVANIRRQTCNDGMSDRTFGFAISLYNRETVGGGAFTGCCTLQTDN